MSHNVAMTEPKETPRAPHRIESERLVLRPYEPRDAETLRQATERSRPHLLDFLPWARFEPQTLDQKLELILGFRSQFDGKSNYIYGVFDRSSGELLGGTGLHPRLEDGAYELGYWLIPKAEGKGYISEAVRAQCRVGFDHMGLDLIGVRMEPANVRSEQVAMRLGFVREGLIRQALRFAADDPRDCLRYSLLASEYRTQSWHQETCDSVRAFDALQRVVEFDS